MAKLKSFALLCSLLLCLTMSAQNAKTIRGTVLDDKREPLTGAVVLVKGSSQGVSTGLDGSFEMNVPQGAVIEVSILGYITKELATDGESPFIIVLEEDYELLKEVVVVGYGTMKKKDLTGSISQIRPDNIAIENPQSVQDILRGTAGLKIGFDSSAKGGGSIQIRGQRSVYTESNHNSPLLVLDGMIFMGELSEINPEDIAQIDILKDASSAAVYGAKSANGVIIITTKSGKKGKPTVSFSANFGITGLATMRERWTPQEYLQHIEDWLTKNTYGVNPETGEYSAYQAAAYAAQPGFYSNPNRLPAGVSLDNWRDYTVNELEESDLSIWARRLGFMGNLLDNVLAGKTVNWKDKGFRTGFNQDYSASVSGATDNVKYYFSVGSLKNQGVKRNDDYAAIRANMKLDMKVNKWLEVGANVNFQNRSDGSLDMDLAGILDNSPYADYLDENGMPIQYPNDANYRLRGYNYDFDKRYEKLEKGYTILNNIFYSKVTLPFGISYTFNASPRFQFFYDRHFTSAALPFSTPENRGVDREQAKRFDWSLNNTINWDRTFASKHHVNLTLVQEAEQRQYWSDRIEARKILPSDALGFHNTKNGTKENSTFSTDDSYQTADALLARVFYAYDERYMITASVRRDGYSAFGTSNPYATFPSVALAWTFSNEKFFAKPKSVMNYGKLRLSYGKNGNRSLSSPYLSLANLSAGGGKMHGYLDASGAEHLYRYLMVDRMANPHLQWEKTSSFNIGLDFGFFKNRINGSIEFYNMVTNDMIMIRRLPEFTGFSKITTNLGQVDNTGVELSLNTINVDKKNFRWSSSLNLSYNKNRIRHLYGDYVDGVEQNDETNSWFIGQPISVIWNYKVTGIWQKEEAEEAARYGQVPGDPKVANLYTEDDKVNPDGSTTPVYNNKDKTFLGQTAAPWLISLRNEFTLFKDLTASINIYSHLGHKSLSTSYLNNDDDGARLTYGLKNSERKQYWTVDNPSARYARIEAQGPVGANAPGQIFDRSFLRIENVSIAYSLPYSYISKLNIGKARVFASVRNLTSWAPDWNYGDPETADWASRVFTFGLNLTF